MVGEVIIETPLVDGYVFVIDGSKPIMKPLDEITIEAPLDYSSRALNPYLGVLSGKATIKGEPIANATINAFVSETNEFVGTGTSDLEGNYIINGLDETKDHYIVVIEPSGEWEYRVRSRLRPVIVTP